MVKTEAYGVWMCNNITCNYSSQECYESEAGCSCPECGSSLSWNCPKCGNDCAGECENPVYLNEF